MNILFSSIFDFTIVYREVAKALEARGHSVFWITTDRHWTGWLVDNGVNRDAILELIFRDSDFLSEKDEATIRQEIVECEKSADLSMNQAMLMDRFLPSVERRKVNRYMYLYFREIRRFLRERQIEVVFAEPTHANELVTYLICRHDGIRFLAPWDMRYPHGRMFFSDGFLQENMVSPAQRTAREEVGERLLLEFAQRQSAPVYFEKNNKAPVVSARSLILKARNRIKRGQVFKQPNLTHHTVGERAGRMARRVVNSIYLNKLCSYDSLDTGDRRIAFYGLHVQPESSIDVRGSFFSDQLKLIKDIRRALPFDIALVVKEHPNFLGIRGSEFFREVKRIPNVLLVRHDVSTFDIFSKASIVFTVSGTLAYEAGMLGIPAVTFSPMYFGNLSSVHYCGEITRLRDVIGKIFQGPGRDVSNDSAVMNELLEKSYPGHWVDPHNDSSVMEPENLEALARAFVEVVEHAGS